jgi:type IX secretion system PorP/SprF family membrane protein
MKKLLFWGMALAFSATSVVQAQQEPQYTQYMYNQNIINPAYAGTEDAWKATALYRQQYSGLDGGPETITFSGSTALGENIGLGLNFLNDEIGPVSEQNINADFAYRFQVSSSIRLSLGLKAGVNLIDVNLASTSPIQTMDPLLSGQVNETYLNLGAGAFLYSDNWYLGLSAPNLLDQTYADRNGQELQGSEELHYFATGGYVFDITENFKLKPHFLLKSTFSAPLSYDINLNGLLYERFEIGGSYRLDDSFSALASFMVTDNIRIGYAYDFVTSQINNVGDGSHEVFASFIFNLPRKVMQSPRFF